MTCPRRCAAINHRRKLCGQAIRCVTVRTASRFPVTAAELEVDHSWQPCRLMRLDLNASSRVSWHTRNTWSWRTGCVWCAPHDSDPVTSERDEAPGFDYCHHRWSHRACYFWIGSDRQRNEHLAAVAHQCQLAASDFLTAGASIRHNEKLLLCCRRTKIDQLRSVAPTEI